MSEGSMYRILEIDVKSGETVTVFSRTLGAVDNIRRSNEGGKNFNIIRTFRSKCVH